MDNSKTVVRCSRLFLLLVLLTSSACLKTSNDGPSNRLGGVGPQGDGEGFAGRTALENVRARCGFKKLGEQKFEVSCLTVIPDENGSEQPVTTLEEGDSLRWLDLRRLSGAEVISATCEVGPLNLSQKCEVTLNSNEITRVQFSVEATNGTGASHVSNSTVALVTADSFGVVPHLMGFRSLTGESDGVPYFGHQVVDLNAVDFLVGRPHSVCAIGSRVYFATIDFVFLLRDGKLRVYAGSTNRRNTTELSHRLRVALGGRRTDSSDHLGLLCTSTGLYVADPSNGRILLMKDRGPVIRIAGNDQNASGPDGSVATETTLKRPMNMTILGDGALYFTEHPFKLRRIDPQTKKISTVPLSGTRPKSILGMASTGNTIFLSDAIQQVIHQVDLSTNTISILAGNGQRAAIDGMAREASFNEPAGLAYSERTQSLFVADGLNGRIRVVSKEGDNTVVRTMAGPGTADGTRLTQQYGLCARQATLSVPALSLTLCGPRGVALHTDGSLFIADRRGFMVRKIDRQGMATTVAGSHPFVLKKKKLEDLATATFAPSLGIVLEPNGSVTISEVAFHRVRKVNFSKKTVTHYSGWNGQGINQPEGRLVTKDGNPKDIERLPDKSLLVARDYGVTRITKEGVATIFAGKSKGVKMDGALATEFSLRRPSALAAHSEGTIFIAENSAIYSVSPTTGLIFRIAGARGEESYGGDGGLARNARFHSITGMDVGRDNALYVVDSSNHRVRRIDLATNIVTTIAGVGLPGDAGDNGWADEAGLSTPTGLKIASNGKIYVTDTENSAIRVLHPSQLPNGEVRYRISTLVGGSSLDKECSGSVLEQVQATEAAIHASLDSLCNSYPLAIDLLEKGDKITIVYTQAFGNFISRAPTFTSANLLKLTLPRE